MLIGISDTPENRARLADIEERVKSETIRDIYNETNELEQMLWAVQQWLQTYAAFIKAQLTCKARFACDEVPPEINQLFIEIQKTHDYYFLESCVKQLHTDGITEDAFLKWLKEKKSERSNAVFYGIRVDIYLEELNTLEEKIAKLRGQAAAWKEGMREFEVVFAGQKQDIRDLRNSWLTELLESLFPLRFNVPLPPEQKQIAAEAAKAGNYGLLQSWCELLVDHKTSQEDFIAALAKYQPQEEGENS